MEIALMECSFCGKDETEININECEFCGDFYCDDCKCDCH